MWSVPPRSRAESIITSVTEAHPQPVPTGRMPVDSLPVDSGARGNLLYRGWELRQLHLRRRRERYDTDYNQEMHCERSRDGDGIQCGLLRRAGGIWRSVFALALTMSSTAPRENESNWKDAGAYGIRATEVRASRLDGGHFPSGECSADNLSFSYLHVGNTGLLMPHTPGRDLFI
ncbi:MAG: hypothetical protein IPJ67_00105 [Candidatus Moraniibacteriota bacterium]|nr:MAG: hypothetical protein IPJ67_00105 [Candidatus Moranbacteria bacterium]